MNFAPCVSFKIKFTLFILPWERRSLSARQWKYKPAIAWNDQLLKLNIMHVTYVQVFLPPHLHWDVWLHSFRHVTHLLVSPLHSKAVPLLQLLFIRQIKVHQLALIKSRVSNSHSQLRCFEPIPFNRLDACLAELGQASGAKASAAQEAW